MLYLGMVSLNAMLPGHTPGWFADALASLEADEFAWVVPQIGLELPLNGQEARVAAGDYDNAISALCVGLRLLERPVFLRIGYEFNGMEWNGYRPSSYIAAYRRIALAIRADETLNPLTALVWD
jgi:hypothetical protein